MSKHPIPTPSRNIVNGSGTLLGGGGGGFGGGEQGEQGGQEQCSGIESFLDCPAVTFSLPLSITGLDPELLSEAGFVSSQGQGGQGGQSGG